MNENKIKFELPDPNNPPAFPRSASDAQNVFGEMAGHGSQTGMTLRDWFAGQALTGLCALDPDKDAEYSHVATWAYAYADAMLEERQIPRIPKEDRTVAP